jgi:Reverse transcriptase (RNA-dependent DNA polymerase).
MDHCCLDINKSFVSVEYGATIVLIKLKIPGELIKVVDSYLALRSFRVRMNGKHSEWKPTLAGVQQGSILSPLLYNLYSSDIPKSITTELATYADDTCISDKNHCERFAHLAM